MIASGVDTQGIIGTVVSDQGITATSVNV